MHSESLTQEFARTKPFRSEREVTFPWVTSSTAGDVRAPTSQSLLWETSPTAHADTVNAKSPTVMAAGAGVAAGGGLVAQNQKWCLRSSQPCSCKIGEC